jgi:hypothetical protein
MKGLRTWLSARVFSPWFCVKIKQNKTNHIQSSGAGPKFPLFSLMPLKIRNVLHAEDPAKLRDIGGKGIK